MVSSEILQASEAGCPIELHKIEIEQCDEMFDKECKGDRYIPFKRAGYDRNTGQSPNNPREQVGPVAGEMLVCRGIERVETGSIAMGNGGNTT